MNTKGSASDMSEFNPRINQKKPGKSTGKPKPVCSSSCYNPVDLLRYYLYWLEILKNLKSSMTIQSKSSLFVFSPLLRATRIRGQAKLGDRKLKVNASEELVEPFVLEAFHHQVLPDLCSELISYLVTHVLLMIHFWGLTFLINTGLVNLSVSVIGVYG